MSGDNPIDTPTSTPSRLMVLMFTDVVGSTALKARCGAELYTRVIARHDQIFKAVIARIEGASVLQDTGDGFYASFGTASDAVKAALAFQQAMAAQKWPAPVAARVGIHIGEVAMLGPRGTARDGDAPKPVGIAVDLAARVMSLAQGGQILMTRWPFNDARQFVSSYPPPLIANPADAGNQGAERESPPLKWMAHGPYLFKGEEEPVEVFEVGGEGVSPLVAPPDAEKARRAVRPGEEQTLGWRPAIGLALPDQPHWIVQRKLGEGGFGEVWLAEHAKTKSVRVFKFCFDPERLRALKREVVLFRLLKEALGDRRDTARILDFQFEKPPYFIEMEYTPDGNLADWAEARGGIDKVPLEERLDIVAKVAEAVAAAHSVGVLHKDIKPTNILMVRDLETGGYYPRLTDFGIGFLTDRAVLGQHNITVAGFTVTNLSVNDSSRTGTRMYAPPEILAGKPFTTQGDVYALGVLLYQMIIGDLNKPLAEGWQRHVDDALFRQDVAEAVAGDLDQRLHSAAEVRDRIRRLEARRSEEERRQTEVRRQADLRKLAQRRRQLLRLAFGGLVALLVLMSGAIWMSIRVKRERDAAVVAEAEKEKQRSNAERQRAAAQESERQALRGLAASLLAEGDARGALQRWDDATDAYRRAEAVFAELGEQSLAMMLAWRNRFASAPPPLVRINDVPDEVVAMAVASDERTLALALKRQRDNVLVYDLLTGKRTGNIATHDGGGLRAIEFSPDDRLVITAGAQGSVCLWNADLSFKAHLGGLGGTVLAACFSPDGKYVRAVSSEWTLMQWNVASREGAKAKRLIEARKPADLASFSPEGTAVVLGYHGFRSSDPSFFQSFLADTGAAIGRPSTSTNTLYSLAMGRGGEYVLAGRGSGTELYPNMNDRAGRYLLTGLSSSRRLVAATTDALGYDTACIAGFGVSEVSQGSEGAAERLGAEIFYSTGRAQVTSLRVTESLVVAADNLRHPTTKAGRIWVYRRQGVSARAPLKLAMEPPCDLDIDAHSMGLVATEREVVLFHAPSGALVSRTSGFNSKLRAARLTGVLGEAVLCFSDGTQELWNVVNGVRVAKLGRHNNNKAVSLPHIHVAQATGRMISADGSTAILTDLRRKQELWRGVVRQGAPNYIRSVCLSKDGDLAAALLDGNRLVVWDPATGANQLDVPVGDTTLAVSHLRFTPDSRSLVWSATGGVYILDRETRLIRNIPGFHAKALSLAGAGTAGYVADSVEGIRAFDWQEGRWIGTLSSWQFTRAVAAAPDGLRTYVLKDEYTPRVLVYFLDSISPLKNVQGPDEWTSIPDPGLSSAQRAMQFRVLGAVDWARSTSEEEPSDDFEGAITRLLREERSREALKLMRVRGLSHDPTVEPARLQLLTAAVKAASTQPAPTTRPTEWGKVNRLLAAASVSKRAKDVARQRELLGAALPLLRELVRSEPQYDGGRQQLVGALTAMAWSLHDSALYASAEPFAREFLELVEAHGAVRAGMREELFNSFVCHWLLGYAARERKEFHLATAAFRSSLDRFKEELAQQPVSAETAWAYAYWARVISSDLGRAFHATGRKEEALAAFGEGERLLLPHATADPMKRGQLAELYAAWRALLMEQDATAEALNKAEQAVSAQTAYAELDAQDIDATRDLSIRMEELGRVQEKLGRLDDALRTYQQELAIARKIADRQPGVALSTRNLAVAAANVAKVLESQGRAADAVELRQSAFTNRSRLAEARDASLDDIRLWAEAADALRGTASLAERTEIELSAAKSATLAWERVAAQDAESLPNVIIAFDALGAASMRADDSENAVSAYQRAVDAAEALAAKPARAAEGARRATLARIQLANALLAEKKLGAALANVQKAEQACASMLRELPHDAEILAAELDALQVRSSVLSALERLPEAIAVARRFLEKAAPQKGTTPYVAVITPRRVANIWARLGQMLEANQDRAGARAAYQEKMLIDEAELQRAPQAFSPHEDLVWTLDHLIEMESADAADDETIRWMRRRVQVWEDVPDMVLAEHEKDIDGLGTSRFQLGKALFRQATTSTIKFERRLESWMAARKALCEAHGPFAVADLSQSGKEMLAEIEKLLAQLLAQEGPSVPNRVPPATLPSVTPQ